MRVMFGHREMNHSQEDFFGFTRDAQYEHVSSWPLDWRYRRHDLRCQVKAAINECVF
jgi:hypothetical protein